MDTSSWAFIAASYYELYETYSYLRIWIDFTESHISLHDALPNESSDDVTTFIGNGVVGYIAEVVLMLGAVNGISL